jgi:hypothetical protein
MDASAASFAFACFASERRVDGRAEGVGIAVAT